MTLDSRCLEEEYAKRIVAYLPSLRYLDWVRVTDETRVDSQALFVNELEKIRILEDMARAKNSDADALAAKQQQFVDALLPDVRGLRMYF